MKLNDIASALGVAIAVVDPQSRAAATLRTLQQMLANVEGDYFAHDETIKYPVKVGFFKVNVNVQVRFWWELNTGRKGLKILKATVG